MKHGFLTASCVACVKSAAGTPPWKTPHRSSTSNDHPFSVQTGGATSAGYIGSHTVVELLLAGFDAVVFDNLSNSSPRVLERVERITGRRPVYVEADVRDREALRSTFSAHGIAAVIHFAGLKAVGESVAEPLTWFEEAYPMRDEAMARAYLSGHYTLEQVGLHFGVSYASVSRAVKRLERAASACA